VRDLLRQVLDVLVLASAVCGLLLFAAAVIGFIAALIRVTVLGRVLVIPFRGSDERGMYVADVIGLDSEDVEIPGATKVERLLVPFWENGQHSAIPSISKQKVFVEEQRQRFSNIERYPSHLSTKLRQLRDDLVKRIRIDNSGWQEILNMPELVQQTKG